VLSASRQEVSFTNLRAQGALLVSAGRVGGRVMRVEVFAGKSGLCPLAIPSEGKEMTFEMRPGDKKVLT